MFRQDIYCIFFGDFASARLFFVILEAMAIYFCFAYGSWLRDYHHFLGSIMVALEAVTYFGKSMRCEVNDLSLSNPL